MSDRVAAMKLLSNSYLAMMLLAIAAEATAADRLVDPTRPSYAKTIARDAYEDIRLEAILRSENRLLAIVNGKIVRTGDRVGGARIDAILDDSIRYTRAGRSAIARLPSASIPVRTNDAHAEEAQ